MSWSYDLLSPELQASFRRMGAFSGGADLAAVAAVAAGGGDAFDCVAALADASLVQVRDGPDGEPRAGLLQTMTAFARERLAETGELDETCHVHARFYADLAAEIAPELQGPRPLAARDRLEAELDNIRAALGWCLDTASVPERVSLGLALCGAMSWFWYAFGYTAEGRDWQRRAVSAATGRGGGELARALHGLAILQLQQGSAAEARDALSAALDIWRREGNRDQIATELSSLGVAHWSLGDLAAGRALLEQSIDLARELGDEKRESNGLSNLAVLETTSGQPGRAIELLEQARKLDIKLGNAWGQVVDEANLALALVRADRAEDALAILRAGAAKMLGLGDVELTIGVVESFAAIFTQRADTARAARMFGTAQALREQAGMPMASLEAEVIGEYLDTARAAMTEEAWQAQLQLGRARTAAEALGDVPDAPAEC